MANSRKFQILGFRHIDVGYDFNIEPHSGSYHSSDGTVKRCLSSFICDGNYTISSIRDKSRNIEFKVGYAYETPAGPETIKKISIEFDGGQSITKFFTEEGGYHEMTDCYLKKMKLSSVAANQNPEFTKLEERILKDFNNRTLKFDVFKRKKTETFEEFIKLFFERNAEFATVWSNTGYQQTSKGRRRSLGDIFMICKYYYPNISLGSVIAWLYGNSTPGSLFCNGVLKRVFRPSSHGMHNDTTAVDEYKNYIKFYTEKL